jgi:membrane fusion protein, heavy metal efflux system
MNNKGIFAGIIAAIALGGGLYYGFTHRSTVADTVKADTESKAPEEKKSGEKAGAENQKIGEPNDISMSVEKQQLNGIVVTAARKERLAGVINATGKVEVNGDRIAHVSPQIPGKIASVSASLGDSLAAGQVMVMLDSVELGEALNRYRQSKTRLSLAKNNRDRVKLLVDKKIAARKDILQAETDYQMAHTELHTDEERLTLYGLAPANLDKPARNRPLLPVRAPIGGVITEKHAIVGELADPSRSLYTVADLSTVWVMVDINEKDLSRVRKGQKAIVTVGSFPDLKFGGRINHIADTVDETTRTVKARVEVRNSGRKLKPEMFATVELALPADAPPVLSVPEEALQGLDGTKVLFVTENGTVFKPRPVETGRTSGGRVEITGGLGEGERYAVKGGFLLKSELKKGDLEE